jgi:hypothetical protein
MSQTEQLYELQQIDIQISEGKSRLSDVLAAQKESEALVAARERKAQGEATLEKWQRNQRALDLEIKGGVEESNRAEKRLYSGNVKNPKELSDLQLKIESLKRRRSELEDDLLETMINVEEAEAELAEASSSLDTLDAGWRSRQAELQQEQAELVTTINQLLAARKERLKLIDDSFLTRYENVRKRQRNGVAVALLRNGRCQACKVILSTNLVRQADEGKLAYCENCARILCLL